MPVITSSSPKSSASNEKPFPLPFLKWAGGKRKLANEIIGAIPVDFDPKVNRFYEPFLGGGALTFALGNPNNKIYVPGKNLHISDMNPDLINAYQVIRDDLPSLVKELKKFEKKNNPDDFYQIRATNFEDNAKRAARFIYLNKTCFNGLWRVNSSGAFNVPFGRYKNPRILDEENLLLVCERLQKSKISLKPFSEAVESARTGDLVYFDPPYIPLTKTAAFSQYAKEDFGIKDQEELAATIKTLTKNGVRVILSNSDTKLTREIFSKVVKLRQISVARTISASATTRKSVFEVIGVNFNVNKDSDLASRKLIN